MAKKPHNKLTLTEKYERRRIWAGYFGIAFKEMKRATKKALKAINKAIKQKRLDLKQEGVTDIPTVAQVAKYERQSKQTTNEEKEALPYAPADEIPNFDENESIIETFLTEMQTALSELMLLYGMSAPWKAKEVEEQILEIMSKFNEARAVKGDDYVAQYLADSLDFARIHDMVYSDSEGRAEAIDDVSSIIDGILDGM